MAEDSSKKEEKRILYDLDIPYEWPETLLILNENDHQSLYKILTAALNACSWFALAVLKSPTRLLGLSSQPPSVLSDLLNSRLSWQLVLSSDGRQLAVVQESVIEIRSILDDFTTARASIKVSSDPYPQWRYSVWSPQGTSLAYANSQGHITVYSYNGEVLYQLSGTGGGVALSGSGSERPTPFLMTALSGMCFASSNTSADSTLLIVMSYEAQITTYCLKQNKRYILLHSVSLLDYFPYGAGGIQYLSDSNVIVIAGWSDAKESPLVSCWRLVNDSPYWIPAADNQIEKSKRGAFQSLVNKKVFNDDWVYSVSLSPSGSLLATLSLSGSICLWDLPSCRLKSKWLPEELPGSNESHVMSTSFGFETKASKKLPLG
ncbi:PREDICTED: neuroblastoma-amplified sequence-like [Amphimedon queenslandica]|uniref:Neuroblastoma-amplified sequence N-terminal domain-containing protein n=1 Tax=Amphimedon queenslandica TaxID=400682 RepID=A0AAN0JEA5_AMPQE|nr:PREDICTED: neuroblastoma-amplified sequence-like [Amphimedon queenslandica]|eukprot:XP_019855101.1 PREDICTED: neuroblastoma-amplified sequence-like [Amphimedon queenslandica]